MILKIIKKFQILFKRKWFDFIIIPVAKVGFIHAVDTDSAEFIYDNLMIETNIINYSYQSNVKRL